jgi:hypothetical protein
VEISGRQGEERTWMFGRLVGCFIPFLLTSFLSFRLLFSCVGRVAVLI